MPRLKTRFGHDEVADADVNASLEALLDANQLGAMSSIGDGRAHINTAYFVYSADLSLYFLSQRTDHHSKNIEANPSVAVAFWNTPPNWSEDLQGAQLFGLAEELHFGPKLVTGMKLFVDRFPAFTSIMKRPGEFKDGVASRMYLVRPERVRLLDEPRFGRRNYMTLEVQS